MGRYLLFNLNTKRFGGLEVNDQLKLRWWHFARPGEAVLFAFLAALLWIRHRANIARLLAGTEGKIGAAPGNAT